MATDLPISPGQTFNIRPIANIQPVDSTPAVVALQNAVQQGVTDYDSIAKHFMQGARDRQEREDMEVKSLARESTKKDFADAEALRPQVQDVKIQSIKAKLAELQDSLDTLEIKKAVRPDTDAAIRDVAAVNRTAAEIERTLTADQVKMVDDLEKMQRGFGITPDPTLRPKVLEWVRNNKTLGPVPMKDGIVDTEALDAGLNVIHQSAKPDSPAMKALVAKATQLGQPIYNDDGTRKTAAELTQQFEERGVMPQKEVDAHIAQVSRLDQAIPALNQAREFVNDPQVKTVGAKWNEGTLLARKYAQLKAYLGGDATKFSRQQELQQLIANSVLNEIKSFAGTGVGRIMQSEVALMKEKMPSIDNPVDVWNRYLNEVQNMMTKARKLQADALPKYYRDQLPPPPPGYVVPGDPLTSGLPGGETPPGQGAPGSSALNPTTVTTAAQYNALPAGTFYRDSQGNVGHKK